MAGIFAKKPKLIRDNSCNSWASFLIICVNLCYCLATSCFFGKDLHRRRQLQQSLRALKQDRDKIGVLLLGTAGLGNPRLMEWVDTLVGQMNREEVSRLLEAVRDKKEEFIRRYVIRELLDSRGEILHSCISQKLFMQPCIHATKPFSKVLGISFSIFLWYNSFSIQYRASMTNEVNRGSTDKKQLTANIIGGSHGYGTIRLCDYECKGQQRHLLS